MWDRISAMVVKEFQQLRRDRRTAAMVILLPILWLVGFGYAANFNVSEADLVVWQETEQAAASELLRVVEQTEGLNIVERVSSQSELLDAIQRERALIGIHLTGEASLQGSFLVDGTRFFAAQSALGRLQQAMRDYEVALIDQKRAGLSSLVQNPAVPAAVKQQLQGLVGQDNPELQVEILYNPELRSANIMIPGLIGLVLLFITTLMTAMGVVRERERGTLEQLLVSPVRPLELIIGKVVPYALLALVDLALVVGLGINLFDVPLQGSLWSLLLPSLFFLLGSLAVGILVSTVSQNQQQAMQLAVFTLLPQIIFSGFIFPLEAVPWGVRWISYLMPLTYFLPVTRGVFLKGIGLSQIAWPTAMLAGYAVLIVLLAAVRFRRTLA